MSFPKINSKIFLILILIFSNFWIYKILKENLLVGVLVITISLLIYLSWQRKNSLKIILAAVLILLMFQYKTADSQSLVLLDNDQQRVQQERIRSYPPIHLNLGFKQAWIWPGKMIEESEWIIALSNLEKNVFENLNLNKYFFGGFPRNNPSDFEKFPFTLLPIFLLGVFGIIRERKYKIVALVFLLPISLITFTGNENNLGPFPLFPFFILAITQGIKFLGKYFKSTKLIYGILITLILFGFILQISYAKL